ncbi:MAG: CesT family type III secretion system chaperone [Simkaniaceae bacterium]|nr:CesT family type III secretion system chaperone [Simkaniaceae bacterium]
MMTFNELMFELGEELDLDIEPDPKGGVLLIIEERYNLQIEPDNYTDEYIVLGSRLLDLPPGKYRENVLKDCLKTNSQIFPRQGILGYLDSESQLCIHRFVPLLDLTPQKLADITLEFVALLKQWVDALDVGKTCPDDSFETEKKSGAPMFGIKT